MRIPWQAGRKRNRPLRGLVPKSSRSDQRKVSPISYSENIQLLAIPGKISLPDMLETIRGLGVRSLMVEGGARVIKSFLSAAGSSVSKLPVVDAIIVTVAPIFVGDEGVGYGSELHANEVAFLSAPRLFLAHIFSIAHSCRGSMMVTPRYSAEMPFWR